MFNQLKKFFNVFKANLDGSTTHMMLVFAVGLLLYKVLGFFGVLLGIIVCVYRDMKLGEAIKMLKNLSVVAVIVTLTLTACGTSQKVQQTVYSVSQMLRVSKDTVSAQSLRHMVAKKQFPSLTKFAKTHMRNIEDCKINTFYVYYDSLNCNLYNVKELVSAKDTTYIIEKKKMK